MEDDRDVLSPLSIYVPHPFPPPLSPSSVVFALVTRRRVSSCAPTVCDGKSQSRRPPALGDATHELGAGERGAGRDAVLETGRDPLGRTLHTAPFLPLLLVCTVFFVVVVMLLLLFAVCAPVGQHRPSRGPEPC